jgi:hypothetical protein
MSGPVGTGFLDGSERESSWGDGRASESGGKVPEVDIDAPKTGHRGHEVNVSAQRSALRLRGWR